MLIIKASGFRALTSFTRVQLQLLQEIFLFMLIAIWKSKFSLVQIKVQLIGVNLQGTDCLPQQELASHSAIMLLKVNKNK